MWLVIVILDIAALKSSMFSSLAPHFTLSKCFIRGRNIADNILIPHEIFYYLGKKRGRKKCFGALKIDMTKAYDRVDWSFLKAILLAMNFNYRCVQWIMECVTSVHYTLLVNGNLTNSFTPLQGLRQRDPLSPYLFLLCSEGFNGLIHHAVNEGKINGFSLCRGGPKISHIFLY